MKTKSIIALLLSILFVVSVFTGCKTTEGTSTPDEKETTSSVLETTTIVETATETTVVPTTEPTTTVPATSEPATEKEDKQEINNNQNNNSTNSNNNTSDTNNNSTSNNKPKPTQPKPVETKPVKTEPQVITDDTPLTYEMANNAEVYQRLCDNANEYFASLGMIYTPSLAPDNTGWFYGHCMFNNLTSNHSFNTRNRRNIDGIKRQVDRILIEYYGSSYDTTYFNTVYEIDENGNYNIIFCYQ